MQYLKDQPFIEAFGKKLKAVREEKKLSQEKLSLLCNVSQSHIARTELGQLNTSISHVATYARVLGVTPAQLFDF
ncbi:helix-turn-helix domain-containing protein [Pedobacter sp. SYP-B3415]|uniref:helix-turn-helix domain-containing protein n=1 Tax=Pedobacter sp. SYP-B3415 TaxID=2496641 RepID=UPI0013EB3EA8|nr:helix-turn-helix transcriptional regulator [Pedobacter sp. SYP-B3415]